MVKKEEWGGGGGTCNMFTTEALKNIDCTYFHIISADCYCVTLQSKKHKPSYTSSTRPLPHAKSSISTGSPAPSTNREPPLLSDKL